LRREVTHQILEDGGPAEQSLNYHRLVLDLYWLTLDFLEKNTGFDCAEIKRRLLLGEAFLHAFKDYFGSLPSIGDNDDSCAVAPRLHPKNRNGFHDDPVTFAPPLACTGAEDRNLQESDFALNRPLLRRARTHKTSPGKVNYRTFPITGYTLIKGRNGFALSFDHGPLGMAPLFCHGHADALSLILTKSGVPMLVDPGTYRYNTAHEFRAYFRSTRAHNTVTIDNLDQAFQETEFAWSRPFEIGPVSHSREGGDIWVEAEHNGYSRLAEPVWHKRTVFFFDRGIIVIKDSFRGTGFHTFELNYHLHPDVLLREHKNWWYITNGRQAIFMKLLNGESLSHIKGQMNPILGWYSPSYGSKEKSGVLQIIKSGTSAAVQFVTAICTGIANDIQHLEEKVVQTL